MKSALFLVVFFSAGLAEAKPIYITVARTFNSQEPIAIDVAFSEHGPVELRILKPDDPNAFIAAQNNLRRAYVPPDTIDNPARYLVRGLNAVRNPGGFLLRALSPELRRALSGEVAEAENSERHISRLHEGAEKLITQPPGMTLVRNQWLNLDLGGQDLDFTVPGFEQWNSQGGFQERHIELQPMPAGLYVLQIVQGKIEGQVVLVVTDLSVQVKQTDGRVLVRVASKQKPAAGAKVQIIGGPDATTDSKGEAWLQSKAPRLLVVAEREGDRAIVDTDFFSTLAILPDVFIYSDRPIYKPGDDIRFRGVVRQTSGFLSELFSPKKKTLNVDLVAQRSAPSAEDAARPPAVVTHTSVSIDDFGSFSGALTVPTDAEAGVVRLQAALDDKEHQAEARVQQYVKPTFYIEVLGDDAGITPGSTLKAKLRARRFAGGVPKGAAFETYLYRTQLDTPAWVDDAGLGGQGSAVTYGSASTTEGSLSVPKRLYSSLASREIPYQGDSWQSAQHFDDNGEAEISITVPELTAGEDKLDFRYSLSIRARDPQAAEAVGGKSFFLATSDVMTQVSLGAKAIARGDKATVSVRSVSLAGKALPHMSGTLELSLVDADGKRQALGQQNLQTGDDGVFRAEVVAKDPGTLEARATLKDGKNRPNEGEASAFVFGEKGEAVAEVPGLVAESLSGALEPGGAGKLLAFFPAHWGVNGSEHGSVWLTLAAADIYKTELLEVSGRTLVRDVDLGAVSGGTAYAQLAFVSATGRFDERTIPFRIVPSARTLQVNVQADKDEVAPLGEQSISLRVSDTHGRGVRAEVSLGVVDKAIYALQTELRPAILDFFYPLTRLNVSNFYSMDFQGYGYGDAIAMKARHFDFASVKPPTHPPSDKERDTAYWNPRIVTDETGEARVTFTMPSNATLWVATAVAADARGRFGESKSEFASRGALTVASALPAFMRVGDEAISSVRIARLDGGAAETVNVLAVLGGALKSGTQERAVQLAGRDEQIVSLSLSATAEGSGEVVIRADGKEPLKDYKRVAIRPASLDLPVAVTASGGGELVLPTSADRLRGPAELVLMPSSIDVALAAVGDLLVYPFGCLEQLVATTVPNIALYRVLDTTGALHGLDAHSQALMAEARSRAVQGLDRILALQTKAGGFTWFAGYDTPSLPLTLIALDGLSYAVDAKLVSKDRLAAPLAWLDAQPEQPFALQVTRAYVLARYRGADAAPAVRTLVDKVANTDLYSLALLMLAAEQSKINQEPSAKSKLAALADAAKDDTKIKSAFLSSQDMFFSYPLRAVGMGAIVTHAASLAGGDVDDARRRFVSALSDDSELSTFDRSTVLLHSLWLLERDAKSLKQGDAPEVSANAGKVKLEPRGFGYAATLDGKATSVKVGHFSGVASLRARVNTPLASLQPEAHGMSLTRTYYVLRDGQKKKVESGEAIHVGDDIFVELQLDAHKDDKGSLRSAYYVVEDALPAGFIALQEDKIYRAAPLALPLQPEALKRRSFSTEHADFFFEEPAFWSDSPRVFGYVMHAQFAGHFAVPPAEVHDMYAAPVFARTAAASFEVK